MQEIGQYQIDIYDDETFKKGSIDNLHKYDFEYFDESKYVLPIMFGIKVFEGDH
ncbi:MAG TPA: hypothetical protein VGQ53_07450 [Chitinophagaceae bacterium]|jgi:hypothetical protein|nr:hypothetical protein [Chitinophagaceae bacterium]